MQIKELSLFFLVSHTSRVKKETDTLMISAAPYNSPPSPHLSIHSSVSRRFPSYPVLLTWCDVIFPVPSSSLETVERCKLIRAGGEGHPNQGERGKQKKRADLSKSNELRRRIKGLEKEIMWIAWQGRASAIHIISRVSYKERRTREGFALWRYLKNRTARVGT